MYTPAPVSSTLKAAIACANGSLIFAKAYESGFYIRYHEIHNGRVHVCGYSLRSGASFFDGYVDATLDSRLSEIIDAAR